MVAKRRVNAEALGSTIKSARTSAQLTLEQLSAETGVDFSQLSRIERGEFRLLSKNVQIVCKFLGLDPIEDSAELLKLRLEWALRHPLTTQALTAFLQVLSDAAKINIGSSAKKL